MTRLAADELTVAIPVVDHQDEVGRKKYGLKKARKRPQFSKR
jgi:ribosomal protein S9